MRFVLAAERDERVQRRKWLDYFFGRNDAAVTLR
jgi:hypothetical protein